MINQYSYFFINIIGLIVVIICYMFAANHRKMMLISGAGMVPFSVLSWFHQGRYWNPVRICGSGWGIEDVLFCFSVGSLVWLFASQLSREEIRYNICILKFLTKLFLLLFFSICGFIVFSKYCNVMGMTILGQATVSALILFLRPRWLKTSLSAAVLYTIYYISVVFLFSFVVPGFLDLWNGCEIWGYRLGGIPIEEFLWVISAACCWILLVAFFSDTEIAGREDVSLNIYR